MINKKRILILCEGYEEKPYIDKLISFHRYNYNLYSFCETINVKGNGSIVSRYQDKFNSNRYDLILVFCDADKDSKQFNKIKEDFNNQIFGGKNIADEVFMFSNPVTLQIILSHFKKVNLKSTGKNANSKIIEELTSIKNYDAKDEQIKELINKITYKSYDSMKTNLKNISSNFNDVPSTNFLKFINRFESDNTDWIDELIKKINDID